MDSKSRHSDYQINDTGRHGSHILVAWMLKLHLHNATLCSHCLVVFHLYIYPTPFHCDRLNWCRVPVSTWMIDMQHCCTLSTVYSGFYDPHYELTLFPRDKWFYIPELDIINIVYKILVVLRMSHQGQFFIVIYHELSDADLFGTL